MHGHLRPHIGVRGSKHASAHAPTSSAQRPTMLDGILPGVAELPAAQRRVAQYLLEYPEFAVTASAREIAAATGTSDASVIRTALSLGFDDLKGLRRSVADSLINDSDPGRIMKRKVTRVGHTNALANIVGDSVTNLNELITPEFDRAWAEAVNALLPAKHVLCYGLKPVGFACEYMAFMLNRIGIHAQSVTETGFLLADQIVSLRPDAAVLFAPQRVFNEISVVVDWLNQLDVTTILITERHRHPLRDKVATTLLTPRTVTTSASGEITIPLLIAHSIVMSLAAERSEEAEGALANLAQLRQRIIS